MLTIYDSTTNSFSNLGLGILKDYITNPIITEVLNGEFILEFEYAVNGQNNEHLVEGNVIKANGQLFRIWTIKKTVDNINVLAKHVFFDLSKNYLEDVAPTEQTAQGAIQWILERTANANQFTVKGDCTLQASARYVRMDPITAIYSADNALLERFGGELELDNFSIKVHQKRGSNTGLIIRYGKNLSGVEYNLDFSTVATRVMPQGANELLLPENYVDSELLTNYFIPF